MITPEYRRLKPEEVAGVLSKLEKALEPEGVKICADYEMSVTQKLLKTRVNSITLRLFFFKTDDEKKD